MPATRRGRSITGSIALLGALVAVPGAALEAAVHEAFVSDVTTRAFSVVWISDRPIGPADTLDLTVHQDTDEDGWPDVDVSFEVDLRLMSPPEALASGIVKVDVTGLTADALYFVRTHTVHADGGSFDLPASGPGLDVETAARTTRIDPAGFPIANPLIIREVADDVADPAGTLLKLEVESISPYPLTAFVGEGVPPPAAIVDLNNLFDYYRPAQDGTPAGVQSAVVPEGETLRMTAVRGLKCPDLRTHALVSYRRVPPPLRDPPITELTEAERCFFADSDCNGIVDIVDVRRAAGAYLQTPGSCLYHADLDVVDRDPGDPADDIIDILDVRAFTSHYLREAPF